MLNEPVRSSQKTIDDELKITKGIISEIFSKTLLQDIPLKTKEQNRPINDKIDGLLYEIELINNDLIELNRVLSIIGR